MKKLIWLIVICGCIPPVSAQVVLAPATTGYIHTYRTSYSGAPNVQCGEDLFRNFNHSFVSMGHTFFFRDHGIVEFDVLNTENGGDFPASWMTVDNWSAHITHLEVIDSYHEGDQLYVFMYDLEDNQEDGLITESDYNAYLGGAYRVCFTEIPPEGTILPPFDITEILRRDLYGAGIGDPTSGFYLHTDVGVWGYPQNVDYDKDSLRISVTRITTPTPTSPPTPDPTETPSVSTPTPTSTPRQPGVRIWMPAIFYQPGITASCSVYAFNPGPETLQNVLLFAVLDVYGEYFFAPEFNDFSCYTVALPEGETEQVVLEPFPWPNGAGTAENIHWYAALTDPDVTHIIGEMDTFTFGWRE